MRVDLEELGLRFEVGPRRLPRLQFAEADQYICSEKHVIVI